MVRKVLSISILLLAIFTTSVCAQWVRKRQFVSDSTITVAWNAPIVLSTGDPIPTDAVLKYRVYIRRVGSPPREITSAPITETQFTFAPPKVDFCFIGVRAVLYDSNGVQISESPIAWSYDLRVAANGRTFGMRNYSSKLITILGRRPRWGQLWHHRW